MADVTLIKPSELTAAASVDSDAALVIDNSGTVLKATPAQVADAGAPASSEAQALAGMDNTTRMTPLRVRQVLDDEVAPSVLRAQAWAESPSPPDPLLPDSKSSKTWADIAENAADLAAAEAGDAADSADAAAAAAASISKQSTETDTTDGAMLRNFADSGPFGVGTRAGGQAPLLGSLDDTTTPAGFYRTSGATTGTLPTGVSAGVHLLSKSVATSTTHQQTLITVSNEVYTRSWNGSTFTSWRRSVQDVDFPYFASSTAASSATILPSVREIYVLRGKFILSYDRATAAAAFSTNGGTVHWKPAAGDRIMPEHFGAKGDGTTDDTPAVNAATAWIKSYLGGGVLGYGEGSNYLLDTVPTVADGVAFLGPRSEGGFGVNINSSMQIFLNDRTGQLRLNTAATINVGMDSQLSGWIILPKGMAIPQPNSIGWTGTAVTIVGRDAEVTNNVIGGFDTAILSAGMSRYKFDRNFIDCQNGIDCNGALDVAWISNNEAWPYMSHTYTPPVGGAGESHERSGTFIRIRNIDWGMLLNNFSYGYYRGHWLEGNSLHINGGGADNTSNESSGVLHDGSVGLLCTSTRTTIVGFKAAANAENYRLSAGANVIMSIDDCSAWGPSNSTGFVLAGSGEGLISFGGLQVEGCQYGISIQSNSIRTTNKGGHLFRSVATEWHTNVTPTNDRFPVGWFATTKAHGTSGVVSSGFGLPNIASTATLSLPLSSSGNDIFVITGTTTISAITGWWAGRTITILFSGAATLQHSASGTDTLRLAGGTNFTPTVGSIIRLLHTGGSWREVSRTVA